MNNRSNWLFVAIAVLFSFSLLGFGESPRPGKKQVASAPSALPSLPSIGEVAEKAKARITKIANAEKAILKEDEKWLVDVREAFYKDQVDVALFKAKLNDIERRKKGLELAKENVAEDILADAW